MRKREGVRRTAPPFQRPPENREAEENSPDLQGETKTDEGKAEVNKGEEFKGKGRPRRWRLAPPSLAAAGDGN